MDEELYEVLKSLNDGLQVMNSKIESLEEENRALREKVDELESTLFNDILAPAQEALDGEMKEQRFEEFSGKYGEKLSPLAEDSKILNGDDYDIVREAFDEYENFDDKENVTEDDFVDTLIEKTTETISAIKEKFGAKKVEVEVDETGEVEVKADGKDVTEELEKSDTGDEKTVEETVEEDEEEVMDSPEELAEFEKELENYKG